MKAHPVAELFPMLDGESYARLRDDIKKCGRILNPIITFEGKILDGRNRYRACNELGIAPRLQEFSTLGLHVTPHQYVWSQNAERRHLTDDQRATIAMQYRDQFLREGMERKREGGREAGVSRPKKVVMDSSQPNLPEPNRPSRNKTRSGLALLAGVTEHKIQQAEAVHAYAPELEPQVISGEIHLKDAVRQAKSVRDGQKTKRQDIVESAHKRRMVSALSGIGGSCIGLADLNVEFARQACTEDEIKTWADAAREFARKLRSFANQLEGRTNEASQ